MTTKVSRADFVKRVHEAIRNATMDPAKELRAMANAMLKIADALEGRSVPEAQAIMKAVAILEGIDEPAT